jgi:alpha-aminoadipic semialdehyde synthase
MEMLKKLVDLKASLIDFECITDENNKRLVFFGRYAGIAGMIDSFYTLGRRLLAEGYQTVFSRVKMSYQYPDLATAKAALKEIANDFAKNGPGDFDQPMIFGFAGYGNVSEGAQEIFDIFPYREISPAELLKLDKSSLATNELIKVVFREEDTVENKNKDAGAFDKQNYFDNPQNYRSKFYQYLSHLTCLINCIFWAKDSPKLMTLEECEKLFRSENNRLKVIGDITCDLHGSIECTTLATEPDDPSYVYDIDDKKIKMGFKGNGPAIMAVDNLPCEVARDASDAFSKALSVFMPYFADFDSECDFEELKLPEPVKKAVILWKGQFTENFRFMREFIKE